MTKHKLAPALSVILLVFTMPTSVPGETMQTKTETCDIRITNDQLLVSMSGAGLEKFIEGPYQWHAVINEKPHDQLSHARIKKNRAGQMVVTGKLGPLEIRQTWSIDQQDGRIEEQLVLENTGKEPVQTNDLRTGVLRKLDVTDSKFRLYAVPFIRQANGGIYEYSMADLRERTRGRGQINATAAPAWSPVAPLIDEEQRRFRSVGWILNNGTAGLLTLKYNNTDVELSGVTCQDDDLILGGCAYLLHKEPVRSNTLAAGESFAFGTTVYQFFKGDWPVGFEHFKAYMNSRGHGLHESYSPQVQWDVVFDLTDGHWSRDQMLEQAALAKDVGCTRLYLDPGWQTSLGSAEWDEARLGNPKSLVDLLKNGYGLELGLWTASEVRNSYTLWPNCQRIGTPRSKRKPVKRNVPQLREGFQNLCLSFGVKASASSVIADGTMPIHQVDHLIDGWYGNSKSWIANAPSAWAEIDLSESELISRIVLGNDRTGKHTDRSWSSLRVLVAEEHSTDYASGQWEEVFAGTQDGSRAEVVVEFPARKARWVHIEVEGADPVRLDEVEIYPPEPAPEDQLLAVEINQRRGPAPPDEEGVLGQTCLSHKDFLAGRRERLLKVSELGIHFWMFDFHGWTGPCYGEDHGHSVPSTPADHVDSLYGLAREIRKKHPQIRIEMHDAIWPWASRYLPGYFRQGLAGNGDYDENWAFEFMWNSIEDVKSGRALALYYYNLAYDIPMYCHIDMKADNQYGLSFWWMASTLRHLGFGGRSLKRWFQPHGVIPDTDMAERYQLYKDAMATYNPLAAYFKKGEFKGIHGDPSLHLHTLKDTPGGVLLVFNLSDEPVKRTIRVPAESMYVTPNAPVKTNDLETRWEADELVFEIELEPWQPRLIRLGEANDLQRHQL